MSLTGGTSVPSLGKVAFRDIAAVPMRFWRPPQDGARLPGGVVFPPDAPRWVHMPLLGGKVWAEGPPSDPPEAAPLPGRYAFVGPTAHHFGHMCAEFLHRLWVLRDDPDLVPLLVNAEPARPQIPRFVRDYLRLIGAREPVLVTHPVRIEELVVGEPGRIYRTTCTAAYGRLAGGLLPAALVEPSGQARHLAVLRGHLQTGRCLGEAWIEAHLVAAGYRAFHPEKHTIEEQIAAVMGAERIVFSEGSALHLLDLLPPLRAQVAVIGRRPGMALVRHSLEEKAARLSLYRPPFMIGSLSKRGRRASALTFLDPADVLRFLAEHGFVEPPTAAGFLDDDELVRADIAAYAGYWRRTSGDAVAAAFVDAAMACCRSRKPDPQLALTLRPLENLARSPPAPPASLPAGAPTRDTTVPEAERTAILHIGVIKTGSTSVQGYLEAVRPQLQVAGLHYAGAVGGRAHKALADAVRDVAQAGDGAGAAQDRLDRMMVALAAELAALPPHTDRVIFSSEHLSGLPDAAVALLRARLAPMFGRFRVVAYLRRQDHFAISRYTNMVRGGKGVASPLDVPPPDYERLLNRWSLVFGAEALQPRIFDSRSMPGGNVVLDFVSLLGVDGLPEPTAERANPNLTPAALELLRRFTDLAQRDGLAGIDRLREGVTARLQRLAPGRGHRLTRAEATAYVARRAASNEAVRARWFPQAPSLFSEDFSDYAETAEPPADADAVLELALRLLAAGEA